MAEAAALVAGVRRGRGGHQLRVRRAKGHPDRGRGGVDAHRRRGRSAAHGRAQRGAHPAHDQAAQRLGRAPGGRRSKSGRMAEACGVDAVILHPRTAGQKFAGTGGLGLDRRPQAAPRIPVIGNGDVCSAEDARRMMAETGCDAVMIGRRAIGYPRIFAETAALLAGPAGRARPPAGAAAGHAAVRRAHPGMLRRGGRTRAAEVPPGLVCEGDARRCGPAAGAGRDRDPSRRRSSWSRATAGRRRTGRET